MKVLMFAVKKDSQLSFKIELLAKILRWFKLVLNLKLGVVNQLESNSTPQ
jgi:hypothetical protein